MGELASKDKSKHYRKVPSLEHRVHSVMSAQEVKDTDNYTQRIDEMRQRLKKRGGFVPVFSSAGTF